MSYSPNFIALATLLEVIYIDSHPDRRSPGYGAEQMVAWGIRNGLITYAEACKARN